MNAMQFPLTRITIGFIFGIIFANYLPVAPKLSFGLLCISFVLFAYAFYSAKQQLQQTLFFGFTVYLLAFMVGISALTVHNPRYQKSHYIHDIKTSEDVHVLEVVLREKLKPTAYCNRHVALVRQIDGKSFSGSMLVNFYKNQFADDFAIGTQFQIKSAIQRHSAPLNPDQFDYGKYLTNKSILAQTYVDYADVKTNAAPVKDVFHYADKLRSKVLLNLSKNHFHENELNVLAALILGQQQDINPEIVKDYQYAGAVHILSVSGLHVGFIVLFLGFILQFLPSKKSTSYYKLTVIVLSLWGFAVLAGLSPSVIRSATMFSFVAIGMHLKRKTNVFHTLLVSLLLILLIEPAFLFDVGFQLSYLALFFILWMQPLLNNLWQPENRIINYFWQILTVSFAAQLGTLPLSLYYFHQFAGLFFITNIIVIPFLSIIMGLGVIVMLLSLFNITPQFLTLLLEWLIYLLNKIIAIIASFEGFILKDIPLNGLMMLGLYGVIVALVVCFKKISFQRIVLVLASVLVLQATYFVSRWKTQNQREWIVFNVKKSSLIVDRNGETLTVYSDSHLPERNPLNAFLIANFCTVAHQKKIESLALFEGKKIVIIDGLGNYPVNVNSDVMLLRQSPKMNLDRVFKTCRPKTLVVDASNYHSYVALWKATCIKQKIPFHYTNEKGFFRLKD